MKRVGNLYNCINNINVIMNMYDRVISVNTKNKSKIEKFNDYYSCNIINIKNIINSNDYKPNRYNIFFIREPKLRIIMSQNITDKVINHLVAKYFLIDIFEKSFIDTNVATRVNRGTHYGIRKVKKYLNEIKYKNENFYYLKFDISKYFYNIDHEIAKNLIRNKIKDQKVLKVLDDIIDSTNASYVNKIISDFKQNEIERIRGLKISDKEKQIKISEVSKIPLYEFGKGLPIGNMTSQIIAILYLNELDHFIKEKLHIKYYCRYMDDGLLIHNDKEYLKYCLDEILKIINKYNLTLNIKKTRIDGIKQGIEFLGYRFLIKNNKVIMKVRNDCKKRFKKKLKRLDAELDKKELSYDEYLNEFAGYYGHLKWGNCRNLLNLINKK